jgi:hypothetical protein
MKQRKCGMCGKLTTGGKWSPYFCPECDEKRMAHLNKQFGEIEKYLQKSRGEDEGK